MNKRGLALALLAAWGVSRLMGRGGSANRERLKGRAEQLQGRIQQFVGEATGSGSKRVRGEFTEAKGIGREKVADVEAAIDEMASTGGYQERERLE